MAHRRFNIHEVLPFSRITLKLEDKIILGIGALFLLSILIFVGLANRIFNHFDGQNKRWNESVQRPQSVPDRATSQKTQLPSASQSEDAAQDSYDAWDESFAQLQKTFEENQKKREAAFKDMEKNFQEGFRKASKAYDERSKNFFKRFDEITARTQAEYDKKVAKLVQ